MNSNSYHYLNFAKHSIEEVFVKRLLPLFFLMLPMAAFAADNGYRLVIQGHRFQPAKLTIPAGEKIKLVVENRDATPEEFESHALNREKVIPGRRSAPIFIGPLKPGRYPFVGEFHEETAKGVIVAQ
jgi:plastocyanin